jgi:hypothetical protein
MGQASSNDAERFPVLNPGWWGGVWGWFFVPLVWAWLLMTVSLYGAITGIVVGLAVLAFWFWRARRWYESPEKNFVQLGEDEMRITVCGWLSLKVPYSRIVHVRAAAHLSVLERTLWTISKGEVPSYLEIELSRPRLLPSLALPWRSKRVFVKPLESTQLELALQARLDRFARRQSETLL